MRLPCACCNHRALIALEHPPNPPTADINDGDAVDGADLATMLGFWGACSD